MRGIREAVGTVLIVAICSGAALADPKKPFRADSPFIRDDHDRVVFFHGVNAVWKIAPYYPPSKTYTAGAVDEAHSFFDGRDAQFLADNGLNSVRLGVLFVGVEPEQDLFDERYLDRIEELVEMLEGKGVTVLLDFHQDMYHERFQGEGFPLWATHTEALADPEVPGVGIVPVAEFTQPPDEMSRFGFPGNYFTPPVMRAFDNLWLNNFGLWAEYRDAWAAVAGRFKKKSNVVGYDLLNEPWPGTQWPTCANSQGCPAFDAGRLQPFFEHVIAGIRGADPEGIVWWEPNVTNDFGAANGVGTVTPIYDPSANHGVSFHAYCLVGGLAPGITRESDPACPIQEEFTFQRQLEAAERNGSAMFLTEFGASDEIADVARVAHLADEFMVSWHYWHYGSWSDPTGNPAAEGLFHDDLRRFEGGQLKEEKANVLIRTYPQAVAGTPESFSFDPSTKEFHLRYLADPAIEEPTVIFVPVERHYGGHYQVTTTGLVERTSAADAPLLELKNTGAGTVTITVTKQASP